jgi:hypothetical protein
MTSWFIRPTKAGTYQVTYRSGRTGAVQVFHETRGAMAPDEMLKWVVRKGELAAGDIIHLPDGGVVVCALTEGRA